MTAQELEEALAGTSHTLAHVHGRGPHCDPIDCITLELSNGRLIEITSGTNPDRIPELVLTEVPDA